MEKKKAKGKGEGIKALILDLDDTLWDTTGQLVKKGQIAALEEMAKHGLPIKKSDAAKTRDMLVKRYGQHVNITTKALEHFGMYKDKKNRKNAEKIRLIGHHRYHTVRIGKIRPFKDTVPTLKKLKKDGRILVLLSYGVARQQNSKIRKLGIRRYFDRIVLDTTIGRSNKPMHIKEIIRWLGKRGVRKDEILLVGDRPNSEIEGGKRLGLKTARMIHAHGRYSRLKPQNRWQKADFRIRRISNLYGVLDRLDNQR